MPKHPLHILLVDDSPADSRLVQIWLKRSSVVGRVDAVDTGAAALARLRGEGPFAGQALPDLVLHDVNLPDMLVWDVIDAARLALGAGCPPFLILAGTHSDSDAALAASRQAWRYLAKPFDADEFEQLIALIESFGEVS